MAVSILCFCLSFLPVGFSLICSENAMRNITKIHVSFDR